MPDLPLHSVSVAGVVVAEDGRLLAIRRRDNGRWELPGGVLELGESIHAGVVREVREETGVTVGVDRLTGVYKNMSRGVVALVFRCHLIDGSPRPTDEAADVAWLTELEVTDRMSEAFAVRLTDAVGAPAAPWIREHDGERLVPPSRRMI